MEANFQEVKPQNKKTILKVKFKSQGIHLPISLGNTTKRLEQDDDRVTLRACHKPTKESRNDDFP